MKTIIKSIVFSYIALILSRKAINGLSFGSDEIRSMALILIALSLLNMFMVPIFKLISLPFSGIVFIFFSFILNLIILYTLTIFIPNFKIIESTIPQLRIFGFMLPSKHLTVFWSAISSSLVFTLVYGFFDWMGRR